MDIGEFRGLLTALLLALFIGIWISAYSRRRESAYRAAERLPLDDDSGMRPGEPGGGAGETDKRAEEDRA